MWGWCEHVQWLQRLSVASFPHAGPLRVFGLGFEYGAQGRRELPRCGWELRGAMLQREQAQKPAMLGERRGTGSALPH